ncbi:TetR/AcrR family transcriptional regulator [Niveibacterium sp. SC-1]|uniref:TetR/AcrR family transcriptional regulator n=1 Tax=Niveibacterium sp. SC-1 TaxID=3135646 RepID=UPI00311DD8DC
MIRNLPPREPAVRQRRKEARPSELADAALELFVEKGFAATRLEEIAGRAGVSKGTLYLYFDSKEALFESVIREGLLPLIEAGETITQFMPGGGWEGDIEALANHAGLPPGAEYLRIDRSDDRPVEADKLGGIVLANHYERLLRVLLFGWWDRIGASRLGGIPKLMNAEAANFPEVARFFREQVISRGRKLVASVLEAGMANGAFRPLPIEDSVTLFLAPAIHLAMTWQSPAFCGSEVTDPHAFLSNYLEIFVRGIRADARGQPQ